MMSCWEFEPKDRPEFSEIVERIDGFNNFAAK